MAAKVLDGPISLLSRPNIKSLQFAPARFCLRPQQTERHRTFMLCIKRCLGAIPGLLLQSQRMAGLIGARRLQLVIILRAWGCSIRPSMFHQMVRRSRLPFMTIEITPAPTCWLIFTWHNLLMVVLTGNPTSGLLPYQQMLHYP